MNKNILFIDSAHPLLENQLKKLGFKCDYFPLFKRDDYKKIIKDYTGIIIRSKIKLDKDFLIQAKQLKFIARVGAGMENIDTEYAASKKIVCLNAPEGNRDAVGEHAVAMLLALFNNLLNADAEVRRGIWLREKNRGHEIGGKTVGIIGYGNTGSAFGNKLKGFNCKIMAYDKYKKGFGNNFVKEVSKTELFKKAEIVSIHVPLTDETQYMVNKQFINNFSNEFYLINTSRGKVVNTSDLVNALQSGKIKGACLDVLEYEGNSFENLHKGNFPEPFKYLVQMHNTVLSPHIAGLTYQSYYKLSEILIKKIKNLNLI